MYLTFFDCWDKKPSPRKLKEKPSEGSVFQKGRVHAHHGREQNIRSVGIQNGTREVTESLLIETNISERQRQIERGGEREHLCMH